MRGDTMGFKYRRPSVKIGGVRFRKTKNGVSISRKNIFGGRKTYNTATGKTTTTYKTGIKGLSYQTVSGGTRKTKPNKPMSVSNNTQDKSIHKKQHSPKTYKVCGIVAIVFAIIAIMLGVVSITAGGWVLLVFGVLLLLFGINYRKKGKDGQSQEQQGE